MATISGTTSELTGGKFANGAVTGAFVHMFNTYGTDPINKLAYGDPKEMADAAGNVASLFQFVGSLEIPIVSFFADIASAFSLVNKHLLLYEANIVKPDEILLDSTLAIMPMPTAKQDFILDTVTSQFYDKLKEK